ncbi:hypothetical protein C8F01DRAFT_572054 [Mycena amicta]|nr:hypothetical protein C8F01DRAFT_572054 [Mycena amicta]
MTGLVDLPVELLYEVQLYALSATLPLTNRRLHAVFTASPPSFKAQYILGHVHSTPRISDLVTIALRFPMCCENVLDAILRDRPQQNVPVDSETTTESSPLKSVPELPRRLFRSLALRTSSEPPYSEDDAPFPLVRFLFTDPRISPPDADSHSGYALARAVHAEFLPLVRLLLSRGASPGNKNGLAVLIAIRKKKLALVKLLVEREEMDHLGRRQKGVKRRKLEDRIKVTPEMLKTAVKAKARDISDYFIQEKGCMPDIHTLNMLVR